MDDGCRQTNDGAQSNLNYQPNSAVSWLLSGYPAALPFTNSRNFYLAMCDIGVGGSFVQAGLYTVRWQGSGTVGFGAGVTIISHASQMLLVRISLSGTSGLNVRLLRSNATDPVTHISIVATSSTNTTATNRNDDELPQFNPDFLFLFSGFDHIRFTMWSKLTSGVAKTWSTRTLPSSVSQLGGDGVAIEHMVALIKETNVSSAWFSFPLASDDYNYNMLQLLANTLPANRALKVCCCLSMAYFFNNFI
jgi:hypothetical protein